MNKTIKLTDNRSITVVSADNTSEMFSKNEEEMDTRAKEAVKSAIHKAKTCRKPIARYDRVKQKAYIETEDGKKTYVG
ncbi:MAG: hypothetical protein E7384_03505 [Ruminococcaceae bacterium]|nr:hypothetical protein [Oscillospiraceae bacterium]